MKQRQFITTVSLIIALTGLSPMVAAAGSTLGGEATGLSPMVAAAESTSAVEANQANRAPSQSRTSFKLSAEQMDKVSAGAIKPFYSWLFNICPDCVVSLIMDHGVNIYE